MLTLREQGQVLEISVSGTPISSLPISKIWTAQEFAASRGFQMPADTGWREVGMPAGQQAVLSAALKFFGVSKRE